MQLILELLTGTRVRDYAKGAEDKRAGAVYRIEKGQAQAAKNRARSDPMATPADKKAASKEYLIQKGLLRKKRDEKRGVPK